MPYKDPQKKKECDKLWMRRKRKTPEYKKYLESKRTPEQKTKTAYAIQWRRNNLDKIKRYVDVENKRNPWGPRDRRLRFNFGIDGHQYDTYLLNQKNLCAICSSQMTKPCLDHDHKTEIVRSFLCSQCNSGLGMYDDDPDLLQKAAKYILKHKYENYEIYGEQLSLFPEMRLTPPPEPKRRT